MPYTKRKAHHGKADTLLDYIMDEEKTDEGLLVSGQNCNPDLAKTEFANAAVNNDKGSRVAYHLIQSFSPLDKLTPEQAHEIGLRMAKELYPDFQCVIATHTDRGHIHNHIAINAVNLNGRKLNDKLTDDKEGLYGFMNVSNDIAAEYGCFILPRFEMKAGDKKIPSNMYRHYRHTTWKQQAVKDMADLRRKCSNLEEFVVGLFDLGYDVKYGKHISIKPQGKERYARLHTIDENFSADNLRRFFTGKAPTYHYKYGGKRYIETDVNEEYVDFYEELKTALNVTSGFASKSGEMPTFQRRKTYTEIRCDELQKMLDVFEKNNINSFDDLEHCIKTRRSEIKNRHIQIKTLERNNNDLLERIEKAQSFIALKETYDYAMSYKEMDDEYVLPPEAEAFAALKAELGIETVEDAKAIIKSAGQVRKELNNLRSEIFDLQQELYQFDIYKERELLKDDELIHNIKVGDNRIDYKNSTETHWCIQLPHSDYYVMVNKALVTHNQKYGYNTLFLVSDGYYKVYEKTANSGLQSVVTLKADELEDYIATQKNKDIDLHK